MTNFWVICSFNLIIIKNNIQARTHILRLLLLTHKSTLFEHNTTNTKILADCQVGQEVTQRNKKIRSIFKIKAVVKVITPTPQKKQKKKKNANDKCNHIFLCHIVVDTNGKQVRGVN